MSRYKFIPMITLLFISIFSTSANDTIFIKVHFLYGSKPKRAFKETEKKWFGGKLGGHVGIEVEENSIIDFIPYGNVHVFADKQDYNSKFVIHNTESFWQIFGSPAASVKQMSISIPISAKQKRQLDSIVEAYTNETPYDYAFFGMRCGAATYDILSQIGIVKEYSHRRTYLKIFYPKKLRNRLTEKASYYNWSVARHEGTDRRKWERD